MSASASSSSSSSAPVSVHCGSRGVRGGVRGGRGFHGQHPAAAAAAAAAAAVHMRHLRSIANGELPVAALNTYLEMYDLLVEQGVDLPTAQKTLDVLLGNAPSPDAATTVGVPGECRYFAKSVPCVWGKKCRYTHGDKKNTTTWKCKGDAEGCMGTSDKCKGRPHPNRDAAIAAAVAAAIPQTIT
jgi:hypothetical protein